MNSATKHFHYNDVNTALHATAIIENSYHIWYDNYGLLQFQVTGILSECICKTSRIVIRSDMQSKYFNFPVKNFDVFDIGNLDIHFNTSAI